MAMEVRKNDNKANGPSACCGDSLTSWDGLCVNNTERLWETGGSHCLEGAVRARRSPTPCADPAALRVWEPRPLHRPICLRGRQRAHWPAGCCQGQGIPNGKKQGVLQETDSSPDTTFSGEHHTEPPPGRAMKAKGIMIANMVICFQMNAKLMNQISSFCKL